jgi:hypothetical protein
MVMIGHIEGCVRPESYKKAAYLMNKTGILLKNLILTDKIAMFVTVFKRILFRI